MLSGYPMTPPPFYTVGVVHGYTNIFVGGYFNDVSVALKYVDASDRWEHMGDGPIREPWLGAAGAITVRESIFPKCN